MLASVGAKQGSNLVLIIGFLARFEVARVGHRLIRVNRHGLGSGDHPAKESEGASKRLSRGNLTTVFAQGLSQNLKFIRKEYICAGYNASRIYCSHYDIHVVFRVA